MKMQKVRIYDMGPSSMELVDKLLIVANTIEHNQEVLGWTSPNIADYQKQDTRQSLDLEPIDDTHHFRMRQGDTIQVVADGTPYEMTAESIGTEILRGEGRHHRYCDFVIKWTPTEPPKEGTMSDEPKEQTATERIA